MLTIRGAYHNHLADRALGERLVNRLPEPGYRRRHLDATTFEKINNCFGSIRRSKLCFSIELRSANCHDLFDRYVEVMFKSFDALYPMYCPLQPRIVSLGAGGRNNVLRQLHHPPSPGVPTISSASEEALDRCVLGFDSESDVVIEKDWYAVNVPTVPRVCVAPAYPQGEGKFTSHGLV